MKHFVTKNKCNIKKLFSFLLLLHEVSRTSFCVYPLLDKKYKNIFLHITLKIFLSLTSYKNKILLTDLITPPWPAEGVLSTKLKNKSRYT